jgi:SagB-type dehydrogenase family enzyme
MDRSSIDLPGLVYKLFYFRPTHQPVTGWGEHYDIAQQLRLDLGQSSPWHRQEHNMTEKIKIRHHFSSLVESIDREANNLTIHRPDLTPISFTTPGPHCADALISLRGKGTTRQNLIALASADNDLNATEAIDYYLGRFCFGRLLDWDILLNGEVIAHTRSHDSRYGPNEIESPPQDLTLSRFALIRREGSDMILESVETCGQMVLSNPAIALLGRLTEHPEEELTRSFRDVLWRFGFLEDIAVDESPARMTWEFHDKLMHEASRAHRDNRMLGATYRFEDQFASPPAVKPEMEGEVVPLLEIDVPLMEQSSASLHDVMERRISGRDYGSQILSLADLSHFLYRVARTKQVQSQGGPEVQSRPYPSGGSLHELEFYVAVRQCEGLMPGLYHYQGLNHLLRHLPNSEAAAQRMHTLSATCMGQPDLPPDALIVVSSRHPRIAMKYEGISYRTSLLNAGVAIQTMYLVATDMGLQGCATGMGDSRIFEAVTGLDRFEETTITEFALSAPAKSD